MTKYRVRKNHNQLIVLDKSGEYVVELVGEGAQVEVLGAFRLMGKETLDVSITVIHAAKHTVADTLVRAVVGGQAQATISGRIVVKKGAADTNSFLTEKVLLVSEGARATAVPDLEIEADEVKCSHAATVGTIDEEQLFYLEARGVGNKRAKEMIADGFLEPVRERMRAGSI